MVPEEDKIVELELCSIIGQSRVAMKLFYTYIQGTWMEGVFSDDIGAEQVVERSIPYLILVFISGAETSGYS